MRVFFGGALALPLLFGLWTSSASAASPQITGTSVVAGSTSAIFKAEINPQKKATKYHFEYGTAGPCEPSSCTSTSVGKLPTGSSPVQVEAPVEGLTAGTLYHFRIVAENGEVTKGPDRTFYTFSGEPITGPPDGRAYEQATPVDKDGGDAVGEQALTKAAANGEGITFGSTFGIPGGVGAQGLPLYLGARQGVAGWSTQGLFPPAELGQRARVEGWLPDFSETFAVAVKLGRPLKTAFFALSTTGKAPTVIASYVDKAEYFFAGTSEDASTVVFESEAPQPADPAAIKGVTNVYAWDRASGTLRLASVFNDKASPPRGAFAGPYDWSRGATATSLRKGGSKSAYYLEDEHAVTSSGDVYFTAASTGQLYLRVNPTQEQSPLNGEGKCTNPALACTIHVSASEKTNGKGPDGTDPAGLQPAAFQAASEDGTKAFFTSPEKLTNDANTGEEQPAASIGIGPVGGGSIEKADFIAKHAVGVAVDSKYLYWADPAAGTIERAELSKPDSPEPFITPGPVKCEVEGSEPAEFEEVESKPRYVAVDANHIYWTNTGCLDEIERPRKEGGTIGRADIDGTEASIEPEFITGASDPQGIAVNANDVYWANKEGPAAIGRATFEGEGVNDVKQNFYKPDGSREPVGVALSPTKVYFTVISGAAENEGAFVWRVSLAGGEEELVDINNLSGKVRGIAVDANYVYWVSQAEEAIGRIPIADFPKADICEAVPSCNKDFTTVKGALSGLAVDGAHLYWSVNGELPTNPGNDLYRYEPNFAQPGEAGTLTDLTPVPADESKNGAEVQGVLGASKDGSRVYFVANAVLADGAAPGDCHGTVASTTGSCNLYLAEEGGQITFVARLKGGGLATTDAANWVGTPVGVFGSNAEYKEKSSRLSEDGTTLLFRSTEKLTEFDSEGTPELYRFRLGDPARVRCVSCPPGGEAAEGPLLGSSSFPGMGPLGTIPTTSRNLSADGNKVFFETAEALLPQDTNGQGGCPFFHAERICMDTYEWEAPETGACKEDTPNYAPLSGGCIYLISTGKSKFPSLLADASENGNDVFFFTRQSLVGQDEDELQDVYDARVGGGLASQNPPPPNPCLSAEACHGPASPPPSEVASGSATFVGPGNPTPKHKKQKAKKHKSKKHKKHKSNSKGRVSR